MADNLISLDNLKIGETGVVSKILMSGIDRRRIFDLGFTPNTKIEALHKSPCGDLVAYFIRGVVIALRKDDTKNIIINI